MRIIKYYVPGICGAFFGVFAAPQEVVHIALGLTTGLKIL